MPEVLVVGAGIGGLSVALSLHAAGFRDVAVVEAAAEFQPLGVGLNILPNAVRELAALDLLDELTTHAVHTDELRLLTRRGSLIWSEPRGIAAGYAWPQLSIHRAVLQRTLVSAVRRRLGREGIRLDARVTALAQKRDELTVTIDHPGRASSSRLAAGIVIGADGIHSTVRHALYPDEGEPKWNGWVMWRGVATTQPYLTGSTMVVAGDTGLRIVTYPISPATGGESLINWVVSGPANDSSARYGDWNHVSAHERALRRCANCEFDGWLDVPALIRRTNRVLEYPMVDRDPLPAWTRGRIALLGDAAHPMYPAGSNGATQAIVDARTLAYRLATSRHPGLGLHAYDRERRPAVTEVQLSNRQMGPETVINLAHERAPNGFTDVERVIPREELESVSRRYAEIARFDRATVNRPSPYDTGRSPGDAPVPGGRETGSVVAERKSVTTNDHV